MSNDKTDTEQVCEYLYQQGKEKSSLLNRAEFRRRLIMEARALRYYWQQFDPRVSEATLQMAERAALDWIRNHVSKLPSKGKTI